jgi:hypothetical protein
MARMSQSFRRTEKGELLLPLEGLSIARCVIDYAFSLEASREDGIVIIILRIEYPFTVSERGMRYVLDPNEPAKLGPATALVRGSVRTARASADGRLSIVFDDGRELTVEPRDDFEAWVLSGDNGVKAVCLPGGGVATWDAAS